MADIRFVTKADAKAIVEAASAKYTNQNAIGKVKVGQTIFTADEAVDQIEMLGGTNVTVSMSGDQITISAVDTTYDDVVADATGAADSGLMTSGDKAKLDGIEDGAEVNQNAFSNVTVGAQTLAADSKTDTLTLSAGTNVTITPDTANDAITIAAQDTTYSLVQDANDGHKVTFTPSNGQPTFITIPDDDTTYNVAVPSVSGEGGTDGLISAEDQEKLNGIAEGAQVNVIEAVKVAGTSLTVDGNKAVNIAVGTGTSGVGTFKVNDVQYAVYGLGTAAAANLATNGVTDGETGLVTGDEVNDAIASHIASAYKAAGTIAASGLTTSLLVAANEGKVYNLSDQLTITDSNKGNFVENATGTYPAGTNVVIVEATSGTYKFDVLPGFVDVSAFLTASDFGGLTETELAEVIAQL